MDLRPEALPAPCSRVDACAHFRAARLEHYKGIHLLIEAAQQLPQFDLTIAGEGAGRAALEEQAAGMPNVHFVGFHQDLGPFYERADIFVMPSMGPEGLPIAGLEAMAHGLPCVLSNLPVHSEITDDGKGAYLFRNGDVERVMTALRDLLASPQLRCAYAAEAHCIVAARYNGSNVREAYLRVLTG